MVLIYSPLPFSLPPWHSPPIVVVETIKYSRVLTINNNLFFCSPSAAIRYTSSLWSPIFYLKRETAAATAVSGRWQQQRPRMATATNPSTISKQTEKQTTYTHTHTQVRVKSSGWPSPCGRGCEFPVSSILDSRSQTESTTTNDLWSHKQNDFISANIFSFFLGCCCFAHSSLHFHPPNSLSTTRRELLNFVMMKISRSLGEYWKKSEGAWARFAYHKQQQSCQKEFISTFFLAFSLSVFVCLEISFGATGKVSCPILDSAWTAKKPIV